MKYKIIKLFTFALIGNFTSAQDLTSGLVAWYPFDGNGSDMSGNGNNATIHGATLTTDRHGILNKAYSFDGVDDWIDLNNIFLDSDTVSLWVKNSENNVTNPVIYGAYYELEGYFMYFSASDALAVRFTNIPNNIHLNANHNFNGYQNIVLTHTNNKASIFLNNKLEDSADDIQLALNRELNLSLGDTLGKASWYNGQYFKGSIDDVRIYNRSLSEEEIQILYNLEKPFDSDGDGLLDYDEIVIVMEQTKMIKIVVVDGFLDGNEVNLAPIHWY